MAEVAEAAEVLKGEVLEAIETPDGLEILVFVGTFVGFLIGAGTGHLITKRLWQTKFDDLMNEETAKLREHYKKKEVIKEPKEPIEKVVSRLGYAQNPPPKEDRLRPPVVVEEAETVVNVFEQGPDSVWDYAAEVKGRDPRIPYIIHRDEHRENADEYIQTSLTYFETDDVLCDESDEVVDQEETVGIENLSRFGHGSGDGNVLFVRNDRLEVDYEIIRSTGSFAQEVHGLEPPDIKHSERHFDDE